MRSDLDMAVFVAKLTALLVPVLLVVVLLAGMAKGIDYVADVSRHAQEAERQ